jgi:hypothetical protein
MITASAMDELLPEIGIPIHEPPFTVLGRLHAIASALGMVAAFEPWCLLNSAPGTLLVIKHPVLSDGHGPFAQVIADSPEVQRLRVGVRAVRWQPDDPPKYASYVRAAKELLQPFLRRYRKTHGHLYRLGIPQAKSLERRLPLGARHVFDCFVKLANYTSLHPSDWDRFYSFIYYCHLHRVSCTSSELNRLLRRAGFDEKHSDDLAAIYSHARKILKPQWPGHGVWWSHNNTLATGRPGESGMIETRRMQWRI